jgi:uncharacterized protein YgiM (DUF1202 family)
MRRNRVRKMMLTVGTTAALMMTSVGGGLSLSEVTALAETRTVCEDLNLRSSPDKSSSKNVIGTVRKGKTVEIIGSAGNDWYEVRYNKKTGYIRGGHFTNDTSRVKKTDNKKGDATSTTRVVYENMKMRSTPDKSTEDNVIDIVKKDSKVMILGTAKNNWYQIKYKGQTGYIRGGHFTDDTSRVGAPDAETGKSGKSKKNTEKKTDQIAQLKAGQNAVTTTDVYLRSEAKTKSQSKIVVPKGKTVKISGKTGNWYQTTYQNETGYIYGRYLK